MVNSIPSTATRWRRKPDTLDRNQGKLFDQLATQAQGLGIQPPKEKTTGTLAQLQQTVMQNNGPGQIFNAIG